MTEKQIIEAVNQMCIESLSPVLLEYWEAVKLQLEQNRKELQ